MNLEIVNAIGMRLHVDVADEAQAYERMREFGAKGWTSGPVPIGGYLLPYELRDSFDWRLIGAKAVTIDGEAGVMHRGQLYKRRDMPEKQIKGRVLPPLVKYSRGAKETDDPAIRESADDNSVGLGYVTLMVFRGRAPVDAHFALPRAAATPRGERPAIDNALECEMPATETMRTAIHAAAKQVGIPHRELQAIAFAIIKSHDYREAPSLGHQRLIFDAVAHWKAGAA